MDIDKNFRKEEIKNTELVRRTGDPLLGKVDTDHLNKILRGEISAVEAYEQVIHRFAEDPEVTRLEEFYLDHKQAVEHLSQKVQEQGALPDTGSGPWGSIVDTFVGMARVMGDTATLRALKRGEEHGLEQYQELLDNKDIPESEKIYIREVLLPQVERHIVNLEAIMGMQ